MCYLLQGMGDAVRVLVQESGHGTRVLRTDLLRDMPLPIPPVDEQHRIKLGVARQVASLDTQVGRSQREINLIQEYRARLIADVVTGKVDVRHLAPPPGSDEAEELMEELAEPLDDERGEFDAETLAEQTVDADAE